MSQYHSHVTGDQGKGQCSMSNVKSYQISLCPNLIAGYTIYFNETWYTSSIYHYRWRVAYHFCVSLTKAKVIVKGQKSNLMSHIRRYQSDGGALCVYMLWLLSDNTCTAMPSPYRHESHRHSPTRSIAPYPGPQSGAYLKNIPHPPLRSRRYGPDFLKLFPLICRTRLQTKPTPRSQGG